MKLEDFNNFRESFRNISMDSTNRREMCDSDVIACNFDDIKSEYIKNFKDIPYLKSVDALYERENIIYFIEFKAGKVLEKEIFGKIISSLVVYSDICKKTIDMNRNELEFILVYNKEYRDYGDENQRICNSGESFNIFSGWMSGLQGREIIKFGLEVYKNVWFKDVHTYTKEQFENFLANN